jgi:hypothetical protein
MANLKPVFIRKFDEGVIFFILQKRLTSWVREIVHELEMSPCSAGTQGATHNNYSCELALDVIRSQSYDFDLQRQCCKNLQRHDLPKKKNC